MMSKREYIKFGSVTTAQRAERLLGEKGIRSWVGKNPNPKQTDGCGYAVFVSDAQTADSILKSYGIISKGIGRVGG